MTKRVTLVKTTCSNIVLQNSKMIHDADFIVTNIESVFCFVTDHRNSKDFLTQLGVNKLTVLGRVTSVRVHINQLHMFDQLETDKRNKR